MAGRDPVAAKLLYLQEVWFHASCVIRNVLRRFFLQCCGSIGWATKRVSNLLDPAPLISRFAFEDPESETVNSSLLYCLQLCR